MKTSMMMYSLSTLVREGKMDVPGFVNLCAEMKIDGVELFNSYWKDRDKEPVEAKKAMEKLGVAMACLDVGSDLAHLDPAKRAEGLDTLKKGLDIAAFLGAKVVLSHGSYGHEEPEAPALFIEGLRVATDYASKRGIILTIENAGKMCGRSSQVLDIVKGVNSPWFQATIDIGNFVIPGEDCVSAVRKLCPYVAHVHAKNFVEIAPPPGSPPGKKAFRGSVLNRGVVDVAACIKAIKDSGFDGYLSLEYEGKVDEKSAVAEGMAYMKKLMQL
jgi:sugar phosphate isomerase/epimerase